jgi:crotonobetainyl-CoA:carnitine CoA-transferase CaiB-like acyl-CoA transferase
MGLMNLTGDPGAPPTKTGYSVVDNSSGIMGALALVAMIQGGKGGQVDVSLYDTMISQMNYIAAGYLNSGKLPQRVASGGHPYLVPAQTFETSDGHISIFISHDRFWKAFAKGVGRETWVTDPVFATTHARSENRQTVIAALSDLFRSRTTRHWVDTLEPLGIVIAGVSTLEEALAGDIVRERDLVADIPLSSGSIRLVGAPFKIAGFTPEYRPAPRLGEHDGTILPCKDRRNA